MAFLLALAASAAMAAQAPPHLLPAPNPRPFTAPAASDSLIARTSKVGLEGIFRQEIAAAVHSNPLLSEARAGEREAEAARTQARAALFPTIDLTIDANRSVARNFANDLGNIIERSRPAGRTDATASVRQRLLDFGAASSRINAGNARVESARSATLGYGQDVALRTITAWYSILAQRLMEQAALEYAERQARLRVALQKRVTQGFSARGDIPRIESSMATVQTRLAIFRRDRAGAEAQYRALTGHDAPVDLMRAPPPRTDIGDEQALESLVLRSPAVERAEAEARGARQDARAVRAERLPTIAAGVDAGRYGVFENSGDYDVRGRIIVRAQLGMGYNSRADQARARADAAEAYASRIRVETLRDAQIALADVRGLETQLAAAEAGYTSSRDTRDVIAARFEASQGTLFDVLTVEDNYFYAIATYVQTMAERDISRFAVLARTGQLLADLAIRVDPSDGTAQP